MQQKSELPEGWAEYEIGELVSITSGKYIKNTEYSKNQEKPYPVAGAGGIIGWSDNYNFNPPVLALGRVGAAGALSIYKEKVWVTDNVLVVQPNSQYLFEWFNVFFQTVDWSALHTGSAQPLITQKIVKELTILVPPFSEQHRIVAAIEALFARLDATNERLDRVPEILKAFRQAVLAAACDGRLTEEWRRNQKDLPSTNELLEQIRREKIKSNETGKKVKPVRIINEDELDELPKLPEDWTIARMEELSTKVVDGVHKKPNYVPSGVPFITVRNLTAGNGISFENVNYITSSDHQGFCKRANPELGDILITKDGTLGVVRVIKTDKQFSIFVSVAMMKPIKKYSNSDYLKYFLESPIGQKQATNIGKGSGLKHLHLENLREMIFYLPSLPEQQEIVRRVDALFAFADSVEAKVAAAREKTERLRQSILAKAFSGELVPTEAEIARQEGREYESAGELMGRIGKEGKVSAK